MNQVCCREGAADAWRRGQFRALHVRMLEQVALVQLVPPGKAVVRDADRLTGGRTRRAEERRLRGLRRRRPEPAGETTSPVPGQAPSQAPACRAAGRAVEHPHPVLPRMRSPTPNPAPQPSAECRLQPGRLREYWAHRLARPARGTRTETRTLRRARAPGPGRSGLARSPPLGWTPTIGSGGEAGEEALDRRAVSYRVGSFRGGVNQRLRAATSTRFPASFKRFLTRSRRSCLGAAPPLTAHRSTLTGHCSLPPCTGSGPTSARERRSPPRS